MDAIVVISLGVATAVVSWAGVKWIRTLSLKRAWMDVPNERSSHTIPTPRGGGLAVLLAFCLALSGSVAIGYLPSVVLLLFAPAIVLGLTGFIDDRRGLPASVRLGSHLLSAAVSVAVLVRMNEAAFIDLGFVSLTGSGLVWGFSILFLAWMTNLYNFMDGIDGIEALQVVSVGTATAVLHFGFGDSSQGFLYALVACAALGFLLLNWSPASIFLGDVGSGPLGFILGVLALWGAWTGNVLFTAILILHGTFVVDTTYTLLIRLSRGQAPHHAHRTHAYQKAVRQGLSHGRVSLAYGVVNLIWLAPWAWLVNSQQVPQAVGLAVALTPLIAACFYLRAGMEPKTVDSKA